MVLGAVYVAVGLAVLVVITLLVLIILAQYGDQAVPVKLTTKPSQSIVDSVKIPQLLSRLLPTRVYKLVAVSSLTLVLLGIIIVCVYLVYALQTKETDHVQTTENEQSTIVEEEEPYSFSAGVIISSVALLLIVLSVAIIVPVKVFSKRRIGDKFRFISFNINGLVNEQFTNLDVFDANLVFLQESIPFSQKLGKYELLVRHELGYETVSIYKNPSISIEQVKPYLFRRTDCDDSGGNKLYIACVEYDGLKVCNVHLEGGGSTELNVLENFDYIFQRKMSLLKSAVNFGADVILGDFNCTFAQDITRRDGFLAKQYEHFQKHFKVVGSELTTVEKNNIDNWNLKPIEWLTEENQGYRYVPIEDENKVITSIHGYIVDHVFTRLDPQEYSVNVRMQEMCNIRHDYFKKSKIDHNALVIDIEKRKKGE